MKKTYQKPRVSIEKFVLSQNVALACGGYDQTVGHPTHADKSTCGWDNGYGKVYWVEKAVCGGEYSEDLKVGEVCYNNPEGGITIFASW